MKRQDQDNAMALGGRGVIVGLIALAGWAWMPSAVAQQTLNILCGYDILFMQCWIADKEGFFKKEGLDVNVKHTVAGKVAVDGVVAGAGVMGISAGLVSVTAASQAPIYIVSSLARSDDYMQVISRPEIKAGSELKGKRIGFQYGTEAHRLAPEYLKANGLSIKDVTLVNIPAQALPAALSRGDVSAVVVWEPHSTKSLEATSGGKVLGTSKGLLTGYGVVVMRKDFVASNPEAARRLIRVLLRTTDFIKKNPQRTIEYFAQQGQVPVATAERLYKTVQPQYGMVIDGAFMKENKRIADFLADNGFTKDRADPKDFVHKNILKDVSPEAVTE